MSAPARVPLNEVVTFDAITSSPFTGAATDADSTPTFAVYEDTTDTDIGVGGNMTKRTSLTGNYRASFTASAANGFELGKWYNVICSATVGAVAGKCVSMTFMVTSAETVAGVMPVDLAYILGTLLTETSGQIAGGFKKFFNIGTPAATMDHGVLVDTVTTYTGNTPQTGDAYLSLTANRAEPAQGAPAASTSLLAKIDYLYKNWRNKKTQTATEFDLYNDGGTVVDHKSTVSDNGTTATRGQVATGP